MNSLGFMEVFRQDIRYGLRMLAKSPGFTAIAVLTLALGIGANTAIFSLIDAVMLSSLPVRDVDHLVLLKWSARSRPKRHSSSSYGDCPTNIGVAGGSSGCSFSHPFLDDVRSQTDVFSAIAAYAGGGRLVISGNGPASIVTGQYVSGDYFQALGLRPALGRTFVLGDDSPSAPPAVVLNYGYWQRAFGGDRAVVGRTVSLNGFPVTIAGVTEQPFNALTPGNVTDLWMPFSLKPRINQQWTPEQDDAGSWWIVMVGHLKPGVTRAQAEGVISLFFRNQMLHGDNPASKPEDQPAVSLLPAQTGLVGARGRYATPLYVLMFGVSIVLLISCANVAGLLLARATSRQKELAIRLALGAGRARIVRQLLTESVLLSLFGGALGIVFATWCAHAIVGFVSSGASRPLGCAVHLDLRILAFTAGVSLLTGVLFGLTPAIHGIRVNLTPALKEGAANLSSAAHGGSRWFTVGNGLVVVQVALTIVVLSGAGLLVRTLQNLRNVDPGFDTRNLLTFAVDPVLTGYKGARLDGFYRDLLARFAAIPGVTSTSFSEITLLSGSLSTTTTSMRRPGTSEKIDIDSDWFPVGPNFFETMRIPLRAGRGFTSEDFARAAKSGDSNPSTTPTPVLINEAFVRSYFKTGDPIGQVFGESDESGPHQRPSAGMQIVGVVGDVKYNSLRREIHPTTYLPSSGNGGSFELRTAVDPTTIVPVVRSIVKDRDANLPLFGVKTQSQQIDELLFQERFIARLSSFFGLLALVLACVGLYGLLSYEVTRRTREIGIRMALGAQQGNVLGLVVGRGLALTVVGSCMGIGVALGVMRFLATFLFEVRPRDPLTHAAVAGLLLIVAVAACFIPARRAARLDPLVALRYE